MEPEKAKAFIEKLFVKIDKNQSGKIEKTETINWIRELEENYIKRDSIEEFKAFDSNGDRFITFEGKNLMHSGLEWIKSERSMKMDSCAFRIFADRSLLLTGIVHSDLD